MNRFPIEPVGEILVLAGDVLLLKKIKEHDDFFSFCSDNFEFTYWIPGNHEYYHYDLSDIKLPLNEKIKNNVFLLNNLVVTHKNIEILFSTLWSHISQLNEKIVERNVNDFHFIKQNGKTISASDFNEMHAKDLEFLETALAVPTDKPRIIVTHHVPTLMHYPEEYINSDINNAFVVELQDFIEKSNATNWIYGHHHRNIPAFKIGNTTMLTNQLGYVMNNEQRLFNSEAVIDI